MLTEDVARPVVGSVIIAQHAFDRARGGAIEAALPQLPGGSLRGDKLLLQALGALDSDNPTFYVPGSAYLPPFLRENSRHGTATAWDWRKDRQDRFCEGGELTQSRYQCVDTLG